MKKHLLAAGVLSASLLTLAAKGSDPEIMVVNGESVPLSEFQYLYNKNASQQVNPQSINDYVDLFVNYKLKVADAVAAGLDTTTSFVKEYTKFKKELSEPYFRDQATVDSLVNVVFGRMKDDIIVSHIMMPVGSERQLDSIRNLIVKGISSFEAEAMKNSIDKQSARRNGLMGPVPPLRFPAAFEEAAYTTAVGEISPVVNSGMGVHIVRVESRNPSRGEVKASHILRLTRNMSDEGQKAAKTTIDSIYNVLKTDPSKFEELARSLSQDGSAQKGGDLGWFSSGMMVAEFDSVAFALPEGAISEPFKTQFGWHIVKKTGERKLTSPDADRERILSAIEHSKLSSMPYDKYIEKKMSQYNVVWNNENYEMVAQAVNANEGHVTKELIEWLAACNLPVAGVNGKPISVADVTSGAKLEGHDGAGDIMGYISFLANNKVKDAVLALAQDELAAHTPEYSNLVKEYRDGILLFEISNTKVWDKASKDAEGLEKYFQDHKANYTWDSPKFKSYVIFAGNDSILETALDFAQRVPAKAKPSEFVEFMRAQFGRDVKVERVVAAKGENAITDYLAFDGPKPASNQGKWSSYAAFNGKILNAPEEASDVRGAVVTDYQNALEAEWLEELHKKYPVKLNQKVIKKLK